MILSMNFLGRDRVEIDYWWTKVWFNLEDGNQFEFSDEVYQKHDDQCYESEKGFK